MLDVCHASVYIKRAHALGYAELESSDFPVSFHFLNTAESEAFLSCVESNFTVSQISTRPVSRVSSSKKLVVSKNQFLPLSFAVLNPKSFGL